MSAREQTGQFPQMRAMAILAACVVEALDELEPSFRQTFLRAMSKRYAEMGRLHQISPEEEELLHQVQGLLNQIL